ncbi:MAG: hypothetical protein JO244_07195 [Solirubrobacterales bacterium]|nr:hypothetical protein [Solirubrobacterales bacterium]
MTAHWLAFGDLQAQLWGVCWLPDGVTSAPVGVGQGSAGTVIDAAAEDQDGAWSLEGDGVSVRFSPTGPALLTGDPSGQVESRDQLCQVTARLEIDRPVEVRCGGWHTRVNAAPEPSGLDSFRYLAGWLSPEGGFSLNALRPSKARGHGADVLSAAVQDDPPTRPVVDPRLSTTYSDAGLPSRAGLELWLAEEGQDSPDDEASSHYPWRAAGEAAGPGLDWSQENFVLHAVPMRWHSHGRDGPGVYALVQRA